MTIGRYRVGDTVIDPAYLPITIAGTITASAHGMIRVHWHLSDDYEWLPMTQVAPKPKV